MTVDQKAIPVCEHDALVVGCAPLCHAHVRIEMIAEGFPPSAPGQFVQICCHEAEEPEPRMFNWSDEDIAALRSMRDWTDGATYLRRPFSIADRWEDSQGRTHLVVISRNVGPGTAWLEHLKEGARIDLIGPLGQGFRIPPDDRMLILVGGGVGIPPLLYLTRDLHHAGKRNVIMIFGATRRDILPVRLLNEPTTDGMPTLCVDSGTPGEYPAAITTDDGSLGLHGVVTDAIRAFAPTCRSASAERPLVLTCGPEGMLHAVAELSREMQWDCQMCIERKMGCGMGTCLSCIVRVHDPEKESGWRWALTCKDGPVFDRDDLLES